MSSPNYRAAVIGCGAIGTGIERGTSHAAAYRAFPRTELIAVADTNRAHAEQAAAQWDVANVYTDLKRLLIEQKPEVLSICTPNETHAEVLSTLLEWPGVLAVLMEKPLALDAKMAERLVRLAAERKIVLAVNYSRRYSKVLCSLREEIRTGSIGKIQKVCGFYTKGIVHNGSHWLDLTRMLVGETVQLQGFLLRPEGTHDALLDVRLRFATGATAVLQGLRAEEFSLFEMDIVGSTGRIRITDSGHRLEKFAIAPSRHYPGYIDLQQTNAYPGDLDACLPNAVSNLIESLESGKAPNCTGHDGVRALHLATLLLESATLGRALDLSDADKCIPK